ncbi:tetratricopeptide repeat protein [Nisaea sp.]|uniref:tetratricopeptide repeat protein n=1 Tax=Nisaea sp. TaxID=2024842 RepID=UPI002B275994|nr:tetratricopeptide repeat protein [Nisaea sp.]
MSMTPEQSARQFSDLLEKSLGAHQKGDLEIAAEGYRAILDRFPNHAITLDLYGTLLHQTGEIARALEFLERAVALAPESTSARLHLGAARMAAGNPADALKEFQIVCSVDADNAEGWLSQAQALEQLNRLDEAITSARRAVDILPAHAVTLGRLGALLLKAGQAEAALSALAGVHRADPLALEAYLHTALAWKAAGDRIAAEKAVRRGIIIAPGTFEFYLHLSGSNAAPGKRIDYVEWARYATRLRPGASNLWSKLAVECSREHSVDAAVRAGIRAQVLDPLNESSHNGFAADIYRSRNHEAARRACYRGLVAYPYIAELKLIAAETELWRGNFEKGWALFEERLDPRISPARIALPPLWENRAEDPGQLFVAAEQGIGDEYVFLSFLPALAEKVDRLTVECDERNLPLYARSFPGVTFVGRHIRADEHGRAIFDYSNWSGRQDIDHAIFAGSLPGLFVRDAQVPGPHGGYLKVDEAEKAAWKSKFDRLGNKPKIGICWRSGLVTKIREAFFTSAANLVGALGADDADYVSLVYDARDEELDEVEALYGCRIHVPEGIDQRNELDRVAAMLSALDCVVGMGAAPILLASAVGAEVIHLGWCRFHCADEHDVVFGNCHPMLRRDERFDMRIAVPRAAAFLPTVIGR